MKADRLTRINELLKREIADVLFREMSAETGFDPAAVTITRAEVTSNLRHARIAVSIRGTDADARRVLSTLRRHRAHLQKRVQQHIVLKYSPVFEFVRDESIAEGDRVLELLTRLEETAPTPEGAKPPESGPA